MLDNEIYVFTLNFTLYVFTRQELDNGGNNTFKIIEPFIFIFRNSVNVTVFFLFTDPAVKKKLTHYNETFFFM